jgi:hypothetical protein
MNQKLTSISTAALFEELTTRVLQLHDDAERPGSTGHLRSLLTEAYEAGRHAGIAAKAGEDAQRMRHLLDEATARMPDTLPPAADSTEPNVAYWRNGRQHLWQLVDAVRADLETQNTAGSRQACARAQRLDEHVKAALRPNAPLRQRAGKWLFELGERISQRGAS